MAFYYRINPELRDSVSGFFFTGYDGNFSKVPNTNLNEFNEDDIEHVGWYYIPKNNGKATWLMPYKNLNVDIYMISYVVPIYFENNFVMIPYSWKSIRNRQKKTAPEHTTALIPRTAAVP